MFEIFFFSKTMKTFVYFYCGENQNKNNFSTTIKLLTLWNQLLMIRKFVSDSFVFFSYISALQKRAKNIAWMVAKNTDFSLLKFSLNKNKRKIYITEQFRFVQTNFMWFIIPSESHYVCVLYSYNGTTTTVAKRKRISRFSTNCWWYIIKKSQRLVNQMLGLGLALFDSIFSWNAICNGCMCNEQAISFSYSSHDSFRLFTWGIACLRPLIPYFLFIEYHFHSLCGLIFYHLEIIAVNRNIWKESFVRVTRNN